MTDFDFPPALGPNEQSSFTNEEVVQMYRAIECMNRKIEQVPRTVLWIDMKECLNPLSTRQQIHVIEHFRGAGWLYTGKPHFVLSRLPQRNEN